MNIEIHHSELEAFIRQRMASGAFHDVEDALIEALKPAPPPQATVQPPSNQTGADLITSMQAMPYKDEIDFDGLRLRDESFLDLSKSARGLLTDEEVDTLFARDRSGSCLLDLS